jgi:MFS family permease
VQRLPAEGRTRLTALQSGSRQPATYARLIRTRGFIPLIGSAVLTRTASQIWTVGMVLFTLQRYHSPTVAGLSIFLLLFPGLLVSPLNGALLDRYGRRRLMMIDFTVAAGCLLLLVGLATTDHLPVALLLSILTVGSFTSTLSIAGARSLFPLTVPNDLWDRANAADGLAYGLAQIAGPAVAGLLTATLGSPATFIAAAVAYVLAAVVLRAVPEPAVERQVSAHILRDTWQGVRYVVTNRTLRWLAVGLTAGNVGFGIVIVALPVVVFRLHGNAAVVGGLLALAAVVGIPANLLAGRVRTEGRERPILAAFSAIGGVSALALLSPAVAVVALGMALFGLAEGPLNVTVFSLRQRRTHRAWFGRAFAISISLNFAGMPLGSALAGPLLSSSLTLAVILAAALPVAGALVMLTKIPGVES